jgi:hypothetical protein
LPRRCPACIVVARGARDHLHADRARRIDAHVALRERDDDAVVGEALVDHEAEIARHLAGADLVRDSTQK